MLFRSEKNIYLSSNPMCSVIRGRDWDWGDRDANSKGYIVSNYDGVWVSVRWGGNNSSFMHRIGTFSRGDFRYDLVFDSLPKELIDEYYKKGAVEGDSTNPEMNEYVGSLLKEMY